MQQNQDTAGRSIDDVSVPAHVFASQELVSTGRRPVQQFLIAEATTAFRKGIDQCPLPFKTADLVIG